MLWTDLPQHFGFPRSVGRDQTKLTTTTTKSGRFVAARFAQATGRELVNPHPRALDVFRRFSTRCSKFEETNF